jgi:diguanylate cyclase (GGDEF)-like protein
MVLGGPVAGGWVAMLATFDRRELREVPWYGILANHAGLTAAAIAGGAVALATVAAGERVGLPPGLGLVLVGVLAGTLTLTVVSTVLAAGVIVLRDGLTIGETAVVFTRSFRATAAAETVLGWLLVVAWTAVGWWAPAVCAVVVLALWRANRAEELLDRDELTGLLSRQAFAARAAVAADRARRGIEGSAYLYLDLDGFKAVNDDARDHDAGDRVLAEIGRRLRGSIRVTDAAGRRGGDEFMVLLTGVRDEETALLLAQRIHRVVTAPHRLDGGERRVGVSIGVVLISTGRRDFEPDIRQRADAAMYEAKAAGGGIRIGRDSTPD